MQALYTYYYFLGIGGIGMSALARYFNMKGAKVFGYDKTPTKLTRKLESEGITISYSDSIDDIPKEILHGKDSSLIVYTPAIPDTHIGFNFLRHNGYMLQKRARVLGGICNAFKGIGIAGTHGKTSITTFTTQIMYNSTLGCSAFLGGIAKNFETNFVFSQESEFVIVEADEYDRSFHNLFPDTALITSMDADHLDIYGKHEDILESFYTYVKQIKQNGKLVHKLGLDFSDVTHVLEEKSITIYTYDLKNAEADFYASSISREQNAYVITLETPFGQIENITIHIPGNINVENIIGASAVALCNGVTADELRKSVYDLKGVERRLDIQFNNENIVYIDDYAHHPEELKAAISSIKELYAGKKLTGIFQPHLFSRTQDFATEFGKSLSLLDEVILLDIYPAREEPIPGVDSNLILKNITSSSKEICSKEEVIKKLENRNIEVLITMGAGDIDTLVNPIKELLQK